MLGITLEYLRMDVYRSGKHVAQQSVQTGRHQKVENLNKGDVVAIPAGATHWIYNDGQEELVVVVFFYAENKDNQVMGNTAVTGDGGSNGTFFQAVILVSNALKVLYSRGDPIAIDMQMTYRVVKAKANEYSTIVIPAIERKYTSKNRISRGTIFFLVPHTFLEVDFRRWQKKMHFLLSIMSVLYVMNTPILDDGDDSTMEQIRRRNKWENDDYVCELWDSLEAKYMAKDASSKKFLDNDKPKGHNVVGPSFVNMIDHNNSTRFVHVCKDRCWFKTYESLNDGSILHMGNESIALGHVHYIRIQDMSKDGLILVFDKETKKYKAYRTELRVLGPSQRSLINGTEDIGGLVVTKEVVVQQHEPELRKSKRIRTLKNFGPEFQLYLIEGTRDEVSDQYSYCFNVEDDPKIFDKAMKSHDVAFWKEAINDEMDSIIGNNTWVLTDLPLGCKPLSCKLIFKTKLKADGTIEKFKARLVIHGFRQKSRIYYIDTYAPVARINTITLLIALASIHNLIIHQMDMKTTFLNVSAASSKLINVGLTAERLLLLGNKELLEKLKQEYKPTSAEEKQDRRNEMKARGTLLMALPNKIN
ncbi:zinc finger, CCHC-type containing protein [Tanacetum coccineum]